MATGKESGERQMIDPLATIRGAVLFVSYGGGHAAALAPVALELQRRGIRVAVLGLTTASSYFKKRGIAAFGMADLVDHVPGYEKAPEIGKALVGNGSSHPAVPIAETQAYLGVGYLALEEAFGCDRARHQYAQTGRQGFRPTNFFRRLFDVARPAVVVATSAPRSERAAIEAASSSGVPTLCVVDLYAPFEIEWCAADGFADRICVLNDAVAERFQVRGVPSRRLAVSGNPAFDRLGELDIVSMRKQQREALSLDEADRLIVWISQPEPAIHPFSGIGGDPELPMQIERHLAEAFAANENFHIVMRLHPSENREPAAIGPRLRYGTSEEPLDALLSAADCVVTTSSTVGLEAAMLGIPVVQIMNSIFSPDLPLAKLGFAIAAPNQYQAAESIKSILSGNVKSQSIPDRPKPIFNATAQVADHIINLL